VTPMPESFTLLGVDRGKHSVDDGVHGHKNECGLGGRAIRSALQAVDIHERRYQPGERVDQSGRE